MTRMVAVALILALSGAAAAMAQEGPRTPSVSTETKGNVTATNVAGAWSWRAVMDGARGIRNLPPERDGEIVARLTSQRDGLPPAYIYEVVRRICAKSPDEAAYLFMLAGMRMRYDAYRCMDETALAGIQATLVEASPMACPALTEKKRMLPVLERLTADPALFASKASPWWICSHGMAVVQAGLANKTLTQREWLKPESDWPKAQARVRDDLQFTLEKQRAVR
jgi:hypothetical protein